MKKNSDKYVPIKELKKLIKKESSRKILPIFLFSMLFCIGVFVVSMFLILKRRNNLILADVDIDLDDSSLDDVDAI